MDYKHFSEVTNIVIQMDEVEKDIFYISMIFAIYDIILDDDEVIKDMMDVFFKRFKSDMSQNEIKQIRELLTKLKEEQ